MRRDLSEVFTQDDHTVEFTQVEEEMILPISIEDSVIFRFDKKQQNFEFEKEMLKACDLVSGKIDLNELELDLSTIKNCCQEANASDWMRSCVMALAIGELLFATIFCLILWVVLVLDIVVFAVEIYLLKKLKRIVWMWKKNKIEGVWIQKIEKCLEGFNEKYQKYDLCYKFDSEGKWIQLAHKKNKARDYFN